MHAHSSLWLDGLLLYVRFEKEKEICLYSTEQKNNSLTIPIDIRKNDYYDGSLVPQTLYFSTLL